ncbi:MAG: 3-deoxy-7-phosphoheptulonate synthase [Chloroflexi bacterium]|nr:3-deoxy-7-phosphoheptulonate synthase [Chloroflexota bacterium]
MIVIMQTGATSDNIEGVVRRLRENGLRAQISWGEERTVIGVLGTGFPPELEHSLEALAGVERVTRITRPFKLASRDFKPLDTAVPVDGLAVGAEGDFVVMAGPCSVESREQVLQTARSVRKSGAAVLRGGAFKPRTSPYSFQGLGEDGLKLLAEARAETGLPIVTEVLDVRDVEIVAAYADILQIGARNMQNYPLLREVGNTRHSVLLKRGLSATIEEWLLAAEYIMAGGNLNVILCERGIRGFDSQYTRNVLDISAVPVVKRLSHLPVIIDPSHAAGKWYLVKPLALAAAAAGADGLLIEVHPSPDHALSDGPQSLNLQNFDDLMCALQPILAASGRRLAGGRLEPVSA